MGKNSLPEFLRKTYEMVNDPSTNAIVHWNTEGNGFIVKKEYEFTTVVIPKYFRHKNFSSFIRQLNFYGFSKRTTDERNPQFVHPSFLRSNKEALRSIKRKASGSQSTNVKDNLASLKQQVDRLQRQYTSIYNMQHRILFILSKYIPNAAPPRPNLENSFPASRMIAHAGYNPTPRKRQRLLLPAASSSPALPSSSSSSLPAFGSTGAFSLDPRNASSANNFNARSSSVGNNHAIPANHSASNNNPIQMNQNNTHASGVNNNSGNRTTLHSRNQNHGLQEGDLNDIAYIQEMIHQLPEGPQILNAQGHAMPMQMPYNMPMNETRSMNGHPSNINNFNNMNNMNNMNNVNGNFNTMNAAGNLNLNQLNTMNGMSSMNNINRINNMNHMNNLNIPLAAGVQMGMQDPARLTATDSRAANSETLPVSNSSSSSPSSFVPASPTAPSSGAHDVPTNALSPLPPTPTSGWTQRSNGGVSPSSFYASASSLLSPAPPYSPSSVSSGSEPQQQPLPLRTPALTQLAQNPASTTPPPVNCPNDQCENISLDCSKWKCNNTNFIENQPDPNSLEHFSFGGGSSGNNHQNHNTNTSSNTSSSLNGNRSSVTGGINTTRVGNVGAPPSLRYLNSIDDLPFAHSASAHSDNTFPLSPGL